MALKNVGIFVAVVAVLGVLWWLLGGSLTPLSQIQEENPLTYEETAAGDRIYTEITDLYSIHVVYPAVASVEVQARIEALVKEEVAWFKEESVALINEQEAERLREVERRYELIIEYKPYISGSFTSYEFDIYLDTGGAHPNAFYRTATFGTAGEELLLENLFVQNAPYLPRLSEEAYTRVLAELRRRTGGEVTPNMEDGARLGTAPSPEALQFFYLSDGSLHLLFPPYQVAAYAMGSFDVAIPLSELRDILKPEIE